jgi:hypothetical protein
MRRTDEAVSGKRRYLFALEGEQQPFAGQIREVLKRIKQILFRVGIVKEIANIVLE